MGAKVLHPRCLLPAMLWRIPVEVRNTLDAAEDAEITVVSESVAPVSETASPISVLTASMGGSAGGASSRIIFASGPGGSIGFDGAGGSASLKSPREDSRSPSPPSESFAALLAASGASALSPTTSSIPAKILAVARRKGVTLVTLSTFAMWGNSGFLSRVFAPFAAAGVSVDLIATSQYAVSLTLDHIPDGVNGDVFRRVLAGTVRKRIAFIGPQVSVECPCLPWRSSVQDLRDFSSLSVRGGLCCRPTAAQRFVGARRSNESAAWSARSHDQ